MRFWEWDAKDVSKCHFGHDYVIQFDLLVAVCRVLQLWVERTAIGHERKFGTETALPQSSPGPVALTTAYAQRRADARILADGT